MSLRKLSLQTGDVVLVDLNPTIGQEKKSVKQRLAGILDIGREHLPGDLIP